VQKWQISDITSAEIDKPKHILIEVGGSAAASLHFHAGNKDTAEEILTKLESSRSLARASVESAAAAEHQADPEPESEPAPPQPPVQRTLPPPLNTNGANSPSKKGVHFSEASPAIIPPRAPSPPSPEQEEAEGLEATALYDFQAQGDDELTVTEGDDLWVIEQEGDEWWKCRNARGDEGVVPASYIEVRVLFPRFLFPLPLLTISCSPQVRVACLLDPQNQKTVKLFAQLCVRLRSVPQRSGKSRQSKKRE
jgi:hypothetical protein